MVLYNYIYLYSFYLFKHLTFYPVGIILALALLVIFYCFLNVFSIELYLVLKKINYTVELDYIEDIIILMVGCFSLPLRYMLMRGYNMLYHLSTYSLIFRTKRVGFWLGIAIIALFI